MHLTISYLHTTYKELLQNTTKNTFKTVDFSQHESPQQVIKCSLNKINFNQILIYLQEGIEFNQCGAPKINEYLKQSDLTLFQESKDKLFTYSVILIRKTLTTQELFNNWDGTKEQLLDKPHQIYPFNEICCFFLHSMYDHPFILNNNLGPNSCLEFKPFLNGKLHYRFMWEGYSQSPPLIEIIDKCNLSSELQIEIHSCFQNNFSAEAKQQNTIYILFQYENNHRFPVNYSNYHFVCSLNVVNEDQYHVTPIYREINQRLVHLDRSSKRVQELISQKNKFCCFIVSNRGAPLRNRFFRFLSTRYKKVDSLGKFHNNVGFYLPHRDSKEFNEQNYFKLISQYKFTICFENSKNEGYLTEKLINAFVAGTVPIYWGAPNVHKLINPNSFLNLDHYNGNFIALLEEIKRLDQNDDEYAKMLSQKPLINEDLLTRNFDYEWRQKLQSIIDHKTCGIKVNNQAIYANNVVDPGKQPYNCEQPIDGDE